MKIRIHCVGKVKEKFYQQAIAEYVKRLGRYTKIEIIESADEQTPDNAGPVQEEQIRDKEGARILSAIKPDEYVIALAILGKKYDSVSFSSKLEELGIRGKSTVSFVIGGSLGLSKQVLARADEQISFSDMTFPHQLMRVILTEQIYRAYRIMHNEPYHK